MSNVRALPSSKKEAIIAVPGSGLTAHLSVRIAQFYNEGKRIAIVDDGRFHPYYRQMGLPIVPLPVDHIESRRSNIRSIKQQAPVETFDFSSIQDQPDRHASAFGRFMANVVEYKSYDALIIIDGWWYVWKGINIDAWLSQFTGHLMMTFRRPSDIKKCGFTLSHFNEVRFHRISQRSMASLTLDFPTIPEKALTLIPQITYSPGPIDQVGLVVWDTQRRVEPQTLEVKREQLFDKSKTQ